MKRKDTKRNLLDHSEAKVKLLGAYINRYLNIICNDGYTEKIKVYDLFCGDGIYENGGHGSPLVIMKAIKDVHYVNVAKSKKIPKIDSLFNDINSKKTKNTEDAISSKSLYYPYFGKLEFKNEDYKELLEEIIIDFNNLKNEKAFVFLDPYEYKHIKISHIKRLMENKKTEVLMWLPTQFMYRFEANGTPTALKDFIGEIVPYEKWNQSSSVWTFIEELKDGFQEAMSLNYFVDNFTIQKDKNTVFCLFFFTSHIRGFEKMLEAKWEIDTEQGKGWDYTGNTPTLFYDQKTNKLEIRLSEYLKSTIHTNGEVYEYTLRCGFLPKHTVEIFSNWQKQGGLEVTKNDGTPARKKSFYINYNNYRDDPKKVTYKLR